MNNLLVSLLHEANDLKSKTSTHEHSSKGDPQKISDTLQQQHNKAWKMDETNEDPETDLFFPSVDRFLIKWNCWGLWTLRTQCSLHTRKSSKEDDVWTGNISPVSHRISSCWRFSSSTRQHLVASELSNLLRFLLIIDRIYFFKCSGGSGATRIIQKIMFQNVQNICHMSYAEPLNVKKFSSVSRDIEKYL